MGMNNCRCLTIGQVSTEAITISQQGAERDNMAWPRAITLPLTQSEGVGNEDVTWDEMLTHSTIRKRSQTKTDVGVLQGESYQSLHRSTSRGWSRCCGGHNTTQGRMCSGPRRIAVSPCAEVVTLTPSSFSPRNTTLDPRTWKASSHPSYPRSCSS